MDDDGFRCFRPMGENKYDEKSAQISEIISNQISSKII